MKLEGAAISYILTASMLFMRNNLSRYDCKASKTLDDTVQTKKNNINVQQNNSVRQKRIQVDKKKKLKFIIFLHIVLFAMFNKLIGLHC